MEINKIYNSDCLEILKELPDNSIDLVLTDPPYLINQNNGGRTKFTNIRRMYKNKSENLKFIANSFDIKNVFNECLRVLKKPNLYIFCSNLQITEIMGFFENKKLSTTLLIWEKPNPAPLINNVYTNDAEFIICVKGGATWNNLGYFKQKKVFKYDIVQGKQKKHITEKPLPLLKHLLELKSNKDQLVLDPFCGSGSTLQACKELNRNYIGIEILEKYYKISKDRLKQDLLF